MQRKKKNKKWLSRLLLIGNPLSFQLIQRLQVAPVAEKKVKNFPISGHVIEIQTCRCSRFQRRALSERAEFFFLHRKNFRKTVWVRWFVFKKQLLIFEIGRLELI